MSSLKGSYKSKPKRFTEMIRSGHNPEQICYKNLVIRKMKLNLTQEETNMNICEENQSGRCYWYEVTKEATVVERKTRLSRFSSVPLERLVDILLLSSIISDFFKMNLIHGLCAIHLYVQNILGSMLPQCLKILNVLWLFPMPMADPIFFSLLLVHASVPAFLLEGI